MNDDNDDKNISTPQSLPADFSKQADDDDKRHKLADDSNQSGELSAIGGDAPEEVVEDLDQAVESVGLRGDTDQGPREINTAQDLQIDEEES